MKKNILVLVLIGIFIGMPLISAEINSLKVSLNFERNNFQKVSIISTTLFDYSEFTGDEFGDYEIVLLTEDESLVLESQFIDISESDFLILTNPPELLNFTIKEIYFPYDELASKLKVYYKNTEILSVNLDYLLCAYTGGCEICNGIDDNSNNIIDEGCDNDRDGYVNSDMKCEGSFYSKLINTGDSITAKVKTDGKGIINLTSGWNLVSFPVANNISLQDLIDNCRAVAYEYDFNLNDYILAENITSGKAYFVYKDGIGNCNFDINKYGLLESVNVNMNNGWNLVPGFEDLASVYPKETTGVFWGWDANTQTQLQVTSLDSTRGVWVYWEKNKQSRIVSCSRIDKDDNNAEINI